MVMAALDPQFMGILKKILAERFIPFLPPLLDKTKPIADRDAKQLSRAFSAFVINKLFDVPPDVASASVVDDFSDKGLDAIYYEPKSETLYLLQTKLKESEQFKQDDALAFCEGIRLLLKQDFETFNANVIQRQVEIENALDVCSNIQLIVPFTGDGISQAAKEVLQSLLDDEDLEEERLNKNVSYYAAAEIVRDLLAEHSYPQVDTNLALYNCHKVKEPRATYYGVARLADLVALHRSAGKALYERNIRYYLGSDTSDVNQSIQRTLRDTPKEFFYLNNGVTAVCDSVEPKSTKRGIKKLKVRGLSIINGAQTVASAAEFIGSDSDNNIDEASVMFTLINAPSDGVFGKQVTKARNHQNRVLLTNFASLDDNQERLRREIAFFGFEYHYRPEADGKNENSITRDEALRALALLQHDPRYVVWLKTEYARISDSDSVENRKLFPETLSGVALVNAVICYREIRLKVKSYKKQAENLIEKQVYNYGFLIIYTVMMRCLRRRINGAVILDPSEIADVISHSIDLLRQEVVDLSIDPATKRRKLAMHPVYEFRKMERAIPFLIDLMKKYFNLTHFRAETNPERLHRLAEDQKDLAHDLAERLSQAAPQL
jgi:hypothetical protein